MSAVSNVFPESLFDFAFMQSWDEKVENLRLSIHEERWSSTPSVNDNKILKNYLTHTYSRIAKEHNEALDRAENPNKVAVSGSFACFNTGLFSRLNNQVYAIFEKNVNPDRQPWFSRGFVERTDRLLIGFSDLPEQASYFSSIDDILYKTDYELRVDLRHILDPGRDNLSRVPDKVRNESFLPTLFWGAIENVKKLVRQNYRVAVPQYYQGKIQFLLPIALLSPEKPDLALAVSRHAGFYIGHTCLTLEMAYNNARLLAKPMTDWLVASS